MSRPLATSSGSAVAVRAAPAAAAAAVAGVVDCCCYLLLLLAGAAVATAAAAGISSLSSVFLLLLLLLLECLLVAGGVECRVSDCDAVNDGSTISANCCVSGGAPPVGPLEVVYGSSLRAPDPSAITTSPAACFGPSLPSAAAGGSHWLGATLSCAINTHSGQLQSGGSKCGDAVEEVEASWELSALEGLASSTEDGRRRGSSGLGPLAAKAYKEKPTTKDRGSPLSFSSGSPVDQGPPAGPSGGPPRRASNSTGGSDCCGSKRCSSKKTAPAATPAATAVAAATAAEGPHECVALVETCLPVGSDGLLQCLSPLILFVLPVSSSLLLQRRLELVSTSSKPQARVLAKGETDRPLVTLSCLRAAGRMGLQLPPSVFTYSRLLRLLLDLAVVAGLLASMLYVALDGNTWAAKPLRLVPTLMGWALFACSLFVTDKIYRLYTHWLRGWPA
ncbi:hypothetical protein ACSSS7_001027 [Eimeria intestinalis]